MKRFFWTKSPTGKVAHMTPAPARRKNLVEGDLTYCGRVVTTAWRSLRSRFRGLRKGPVKVCATCADHMPDIINVARVRG
jgi:hypothetical protein